MIVLLAREFFEIAMTIFFYFATAETICPNAIPVWVKICPTPNHPFERTSPNALPFFKVCFGTC